MEAASRFVEQQSPIQVEGRETKRNLSAPGLGVNTLARSAAENFTTSSFFDRK